jgi:hypothetical protein
LDPCPLRPNFPRTTYFFPPGSHQVPGLTDGWNDVKEKLTVVTDDFKALILEQHVKKKAEHEDWLTVVKVSVSGIMQGSRGGLRGMHFEPTFCRQNT